MIFAPILGSAPWVPQPSLSLGLLIALLYSPVRQWRYPGLNIFGPPSMDSLEHGGASNGPSWCASLSAQSPLPYRFARAVGLYLALLILGSSLLRHCIARPLCGSLYRSFSAVSLVFLHRILTDPPLTDGRPELWDGGKSSVEIAFILSTAIVVARFHIRGKGRRPPLET